MNGKQLSLLLESCLCLGPCLGAPPDCPHLLRMASSWLAAPRSSCTHKQGHGGASITWWCRRREGNGRALVAPYLKGTGACSALWSPQSPVLEKVWEDWAGGRKSTRHAH